MRVLVATAALMLATGCGRGFFLVTEPGPCEEDPDACVSSVTVQRGADILFVIDNSGSMGREQGVLADNFSAFIDVLESEDVGASYRIAVTDSEGFGFIDATSCRQRLYEFTKQLQLYPDGEIYTLDEQLAGCLDVCGFDEIDIVPTTTDTDPVPRPRPWLEKTDGKTNLPLGVSMADAFECIGPQGIDGEGLEAPLESMLSAVTDDREGFVRDNALLAVIILTDEIDCSMSRNAQSRIEDAQALWASAERGASSAVCWNAGVQCEGGPGVYDSCVPADKDFDRNPTSPGNGVLYPVSRYVDGLADLAEDKRRRGGNGQVLVAVIAGVPADYPETGELVFADSDDPLFNIEYGIGPGCGRGTEKLEDPPGMPPVRLIEFAEAMQSTAQRNVFSICEDEYAVALEQIAAAIAELGGRACVPGCVADDNEAARGLQPACTIIERIGDGGQQTQVLPCRPLADGAWDFPQPDDDLCYRTLTDVDEQTARHDDDISAQCIARGSNLELIIERRDGSPVPAGSAVEVSCLLVEPEGTSCGGEPSGDTDP